MKRFVFQLILVVFLALVLSSSAQAHLISMALQSGKTIVVNSTSDSGPGSLREAIKNALSGDSITFDSSVFSTASPGTIALSSPLPELNKGNLTIDASNAGVIIDGSQITNPEIVSGLFISSENNVIRGLQIVDFSDAGINLSDGSYYNTIGGDRDLGTGPAGQGNIINGNGYCGIAINGCNISNNTVKGNVIGTDLSGTIDLGGLKDGIHCACATFNVIEDNIIGGSQTGIYICCAEEGQNIIRVNYIGTNGNESTDIGNSVSGIVIEQSGFNIVGPGNVIAYNERKGIEIRGEVSVGNRITQNSIHDNGYLGIEMWDGGNTQLVAPFLFDFEIQAGKVTGAACANCTIEIFSSDGNQGEIYEGQTITDKMGIFSFNKNDPFIKTCLTATATDADSNTSQFSLSTPRDIPNRTLILQEYNNLPKIGLQPKPSGELDKNRIGSFWDLIEPGADVSEWNKRRVFDLGLKYARLLFNSNEWGSVVWDWPELIVNSTQDDHVTDLISNGLVLNFNLIFWDVANHPDGWQEEEPFSRFQTEDEIQRYLEYVQFIVHHFKDRIQYFELWNEPDNKGWPVQYIKVADYISLVERTVPVIRQEYPQAKIVVGSVANIRHSESYDYLFSIIRSDAIMPLVDVISWHPMYGASPSDDYNREYWYNYPSIVQEIKDTAYAHGFRGEYRADELSWWVNPPPDMPWGYHSLIQSVKYQTRGIMMHLGMDMAAIIGAPSYEHSLSFSTIRNLCTLMAGTSNDSVSVEIQSEANNIRSYGFSLPDSGRMIALWTDGVAVDNDPGIPATLTLPGLSDQRMTGIDVLNGFQQEIITEVENGNLVIRNLMVKDYPIILSSSSTQVNIATDRIPFTFALHQNYPNPFNSQTTITYELKENAQVSLKIYNIFGQLVETIENDYKTTGYHSVLWNASNVSSGLYFYQIEAGQYTETKRCLILK